MIRRSPQLFHYTCWAHEEDVHFFYWAEDAQEAADAYRRVRGQADEVKVRDPAGNITKH